jgi:hypothetical protein
MARHFGEVAPVGNLLAAFYSRPHTFGGKVGEMSHCVLVGVAVCGEVLKVRNASDEAAVALAIDDCPVPDSLHAFPPFPRRKIATRLAAWQQLRI